MDFITNGISVLFDNYITFTILIALAIFFMDLSSLKKDGYYNNAGKDEMLKHHVLNKKYHFDEVKKGDINVHKINQYYFYMHMAALVVVIAVCLITKNVVIGFLVYTASWLIGDPLLNFYIGENSDKFVKSHKRKYRNVLKEKVK